jgi:hypothetical protein
MIHRKSILASALAIGVSLISAQSFAAQSLTIMNNTNQDSTSRINGGLCSTVFGSDGVTKAHSTHVVDSKLVALACMGNSSNCKAEIYMTNNCSGSVVGTAIFDTNTGIKSIDVTSDTYKFGIEPFKITIDGGV